MRIRDMVLEIINDEIANIQSQEPEEGENETSFLVRKQHYLTEAKTIKCRILEELD